jgi:hypothetical protein
LFDVGDSDDTISILRLSAMKMKTLLSSLTVMALGIWAMGALAGHGQAGQSGSQAQIDDDSLKRIVREQGVEGAARLKAHYVGVGNAPCWPSYTLEMIIKNSELVVVGTPLTNVCKVDSEGDGITTDYQVSVNEAIKGDVASGNLITVSIPGGRVEFPDGTSAEIRVQDFRKMENGKTYVLFLRHGQPGSEKFITTGAAQGLFEVPNDGSGVKPHGSPIHSLCKENQDKPVAAFLQELRAFAKKWPDPPPCC